MKEFRIAVLSTVKGFKYLMGEMHVFENEHLPFTIKFIPIDCQENCRGTYFNSYIIHYSGYNLENWSEILNTIISRIRPLI